MKKIRSVRVESLDGEIHYILQESQILVSSGKYNNFSEAEIREITKNEARKPLLIMHQ